MSKKSEKIYFNKERLKYYCKKPKITQSDIAKMLDRSLDTIKGIYRNEMILPEQLDLIAKKLDVSVDYLKGETLTSYELREKETQYHFQKDAYDGRIDYEGNYIPHYNPQHFFDIMNKKKDALMNPLIKWLGDSHILLTASGYIDQDYNETVKCLKNNDAWIQQAITNMIIYCCGPKKSMQKYVLSKYKDFWDQSYDDLKKRYAE